MIIVAFRSEKVSGTNTCFQDSLLATSTANVNHSLTKQ